MDNESTTFEYKVDLFLSEYEKAVDKKSFILSVRKMINENALPSHHPSEYMVWLNDFTLSEVAALYDREIN